MADGIQILNALTKQANEYLSGVLKVPLEEFSPDSLGQFPYYYKVDTDIEFNPLTYKWINKHVKANPNGGPTSLENEDFTTTWIQAFTKVNYTFSKSDQELLNQATQNASSQSGALLAAWEKKYGTVIPQAGWTKIDTIFNTITTKWAVPRTTMYDLQRTPDMHRLLNDAPPSGQELFGSISLYLNALGAQVGLASQQTMNFGYLSTARANVTKATDDNGGLKLSRQSALVPKWDISPTVQQIQNSLDGDSSASLSMSVSQYSKEEYSVSISGGVAFRIPFGSFFGISIGSHSDYFKSEITSSSNKVDVTMSFKGINLVNLTPAAISLPTSQYWYWPTPIADAVKNGKTDVTGFKFDTDPQIDFSTKGPFGYVQAVAISRYPNISIKVTSSNYHAMYEEFRNSTSVKPTFLGIPLFGGVSSSYYSSTATEDSSSNSVTINMSPPSGGLGQTTDENLAWVLGVNTLYPGAYAESKAASFQANFAHQEARLNKAHFN
jgi:hypothetical protein